MFGCVGPECLSGPTATGFTRWSAGQEFISRCLAFPQRATCHVPARASEIARGKKQLPPTSVILGMKAQVASPSTEALPCIGCFIPMTQEPSHDTDLHLSQLRRATTSPSASRRIRGKRRTRCSPRLPMMARWRWHSPTCSGAITSDRSPTSSASSGWSAAAATRSARRSARTRQATECTTGDGAGDTAAATTTTTASRAGWCVRSVPKFRSPEVPKPSTGEDSGRGFGMCRAEYRSGQVMVWSVRHCRNHAEPSVMRHEKSYGKPPLDYQPKPNSLPAIVRTWVPSAIPPWHHTAMPGSTTMAFLHVLPPICWLLTTWRADDPVTPHGSAAGFRVRSYAQRPDVSMPE